MLRWIGLIVALVLVATPALGLVTAQAQEGTSQEELEGVVSALFAGDETAIESLIRLSMVPCTEMPEGIGAPPECPEGTGEGTRIAVFPISYCHGAYATPDQLGDVVSQLAAPGPEIAAIYRYHDQSPDSFLHGDFVIVATLSSASPPQNAGGVWIGDGGITGLHRGCGQTPETFAEFFELTERVELSPGPATTELAPGLPATGSGGEASGLSAWLAAAALLGAIGAGASLLARAVRRG